MTRLNCTIVVLLVIAGVIGSATSAVGQDVTAAIVGTVTDPSNAPIQGATVTAKDTDRGTVWTTQTNETGGYNLLRLPVGNYAVRISKDGFQSSVQPKFALVLNHTARVDAQM